MLVFLETPLPDTGIAGRIARAFAHIGEYSYSIYLWHVTVIVLMAGFPLRLKVAWYLAASITTGICMSKLIEIPPLRLRDRLSEQMFSVGHLRGSSPSPRLRPLSSSAVPCSFRKATTQSGFFAGA